MSPTLSLEEKFKLLVPKGFQPVLEKEGSLQATTLAGCCGSIQFGSYDTPKQTMEYCKKRIYWKATKATEKITDVYTSECLLVPDLSGNLSIQWEDT